MEPILEAMRTGLGDTSLEVGKTGYDVGGAIKERDRAARKEVWILERGGGNHFQGNEAGQPGRMRTGMNA